MFKLYMQVATNVTIVTLDHIKQLSKDQIHKTRNIFHHTNI